MNWSECCGCVMAFSAAYQRHMIVQYCCGSSSTNNLFCKCFLLLQEANEVILSVVILDDFVRRKITRAA